MKTLFATFIGLWAMGLVGTAEAGILVTRNAAEIGAKPSVTAEYQLPQSGLADHEGMPKSHLDAAAPGRGLSAAEKPSGFALSNMNSELRAETTDLLTELNARQQDDGSILVALPGDVLFDFDRFDIRADARPVLDQLVKVLTNYASPEVEISGHTDSKGGEDYNQTLSEQRALSVSAYLSGNGVDADRLTTVGKGETEPVAPNEKPDGQDDPDGRQANRRVEFVITAPKAEE